MTAFQRILHSEGDKLGASPLGWAPAQGSDITHVTQGGLRALGIAGRLSRTKDGAHELVAGERSFDSHLADLQVKRPGYAPPFMSVKYSKIQ